MTTRRSLIKTAAWVAPTALVSVAAPAVAASALEDALRLIGVSANYNRPHSTLTVKVKVQNKGESVIRDITVTTSAGDQHRGHPVESLEKSGVSCQFVEEFVGYYPTVLIYVEAPGVSPLTLDLAVGE